MLDRENGHPRHSHAEQVDHEFKGFVVDEALAVASAAVGHGVNDLGGLQPDTVVAPMTRLPAPRSAGLHGGAGLRFGGSLDGARDEFD